MKKQFIKIRIYNQNNLTGIPSGVRNLYYISNRKWTFYKSQTSELNHKILTLLFNSILSNIIIKENE